MECTNYVDVSESYSFLPFVKGWGTKPSSVNFFDTADDLEINEIVTNIELPGVETTANVPNHLKF